MYSYENVKLLSYSSNSVLLHTVKFEISAYSLPNQSSEHQLSEN